MKSRTDRRCRRELHFRLWSLIPLLAPAAVGRAQTLPPQPTAPGRPAASSPAAPDPRVTKLIDAIRADNPKLIQAALEKGASVNSADANLSTPLMQACAMAGTETVRLLLDRGADARARDNKGFSPLLVAAYSGKPEIVALLLDRGADPNEADNDKHTALMGAVYSGKQPVVDLLLARGASVRAADKDGFSPLMLAAGKNNPALVTLLLQKGADIHAKTTAGFTPLMQAAGAGDQATVRLLIERGADVNARANYGASALLVASYVAMQEPVRQQVVKLLLDRGASVQVTTSLGQTPLIGAALTGSVGVARTMLDRGVPIDAQTKSGLTALMQAAYSGQAEVARLLLARGASVDMVSGKGLTALMQAAATGNEPIVRLLLDHGADINAADSSGQTAVTWARKRAHEEMIPLLRTAGARVGDGKIKDKDAASPPPSKTPLTISDPLRTQMAFPSLSSAPALHGPRIVGTSPGKPFLFRIGATGGKGPLVYSAAGLPAGLTLNRQSGIITGKIATPGTYKVTLAATAAAGAKGTRPLTIDCAENHLALTPPMGWSVWTLYGETVTADRIRQQADWLVSSGLAAHGFNYILLDDTWQGRRDPDTGELPPNRRVGDVAALAAYCHAKGLKLGIYSSPNAESPAGYTGSLGHEAQDAKTWAGWGVDYLKYDWSDPSRGKFAVTTEEMKSAFVKMKKALDQQDRDIVFAVTPYGFGGVTDWGAEAGANSWWTSQQVFETWEGMSRNGFDLSWRGSASRPGHWNDPGWLLVGKVGNADINPHFTHLTLDEQKTQLSLWSLTASPLILSCDLTQLDPNRFYPLTTALLTNDEMVDIDQDLLGKAGHRLETSTGGGRGEVWARPLADGTAAVGLFNRANYAADLKVTWADLAEAGLKTFSGPQPIRDVWLRTDLPAAEGFSAKVPAHGVVLLRIGKPKP